MAKKNGKRPASKSARGKSGSQIDLALPEAVRKLGIEYIARSLIEPDPDQPRDEPDADLKESIRREGILQPITVRPHPKKTGLYMLVDGERRWKGAQGVQNMIPCVIRQDQEDELHRIITQLMSNTGKPLEPAEEARAFSRAMELSGKNAAELSEMLGRPRSTITDRTALLQIGPWIKLVENGEVPVSHVVRVVVPLRGVPDEYHREAIDKIRKDHRYEKGGMALDSFRSCVDTAYRPFLYPLTKGKGGVGAKNPTFDTSGHDKECSCGGISFELDYDGKRRCCGNPDWWRSLHRKGIAAQKKSGKRSSSPARTRDTGPKLHMPDGSAVLKAKPNQFDIPANLVRLSDYAGDWDMQSLKCDPRDLNLAPTNLVLWQGIGDNRRVVFKDQESLTRARQLWTERWAKRLRELVEPLDARRPKLEGDGLAGIMIGLFTWSDDPAELFALAEALDIEIPAKVRSSQRWQIKAHDIVDWVESLDDQQVRRVLGIFAYLAASGEKWPMEIMEAERAKVIKKISTSAAPWRKPEKGSKKGAAPADDEGPPPKLSREDQMDLIDAAREEVDEDAGEFAGVAEDE